MLKCYLCGEKLTDNNKSLEHIIPNALGGKLKSKEILCRACNNAMANIDSELVKNFQFLNIQANPKRDRYTIQSVPIEIYGHKATLKTGNKFFVSHKPITIPTDNGTKIEFLQIIENEKDKEKFLLNTKKYIESQFKNFTITKPEIKEETKKPLYMHRMTLSLHNILLGYLKILLGFCALKNKIQYVCPSIVNFFKERDTKSIENITTFCSDTKFLECGRLCHFICLIGKQKQKRLFGIVSLYGKFCFIFTLNDNYQGENFIEYYHYDILNSKELANCLKIEKLNLEPYYSNRNVSFEQMTKNINIAIGYFMQFLAVKMDSNAFGLTVYELIQFIATMETECLNQKELKDYLKKSFFEAREQNVFLFLRDFDIEELSNIALKEKFYSFYKEKYLKFIEYFELLTKQNSYIFDCLKNNISESQIRKIIVCDVILANNMWVKILLSKKDKKR